MPAFAVAIIDEIKMNNDVEAYLKQIDETLRPFSGVYRSHGGPYVVLLGRLPSHTAAQNEQLDRVSFSCRRGS